VNVGIIGTGLIGASIGLAARAQGWNVFGYDEDPYAARAALDAGALDALGARERIYAACDTVVLAAHLDATLAELQTLQERPPRTPLVIDVGSVKEPVARAAAGLPCFVPTHPMAGSQRRGPQAARGNLFEGCSWAYVRAGAKSTPRAVAFIEALGATAVELDAAEHDRIVALTSHLPQIVASAYAAALRERNALDARKIVALCGPAARELLRLGDSQFPMWREILSLNAENVSREARLFADMLRGVADTIVEGRSDALADLFAAANDGHVSR
jgi:prephenate dehydrogenase